MTNSPTSTSSPESGDSLSRQTASGQASGTSSATTNPSPKKSSRSTGQKRQSTGTSGLSNGKEGGRSFSPAASLVSLFPQQVQNEGSLMTVISGRKCSELFEKQCLIGLLARTLMESSKWHSTTCSLTWKVSATPRGRLLYRLVPSERITGETGYGLLPTPNAKDYHAGFSNVETRQQSSLPRWVSKVLRIQSGRRGTAHPNFLCWLMGYPKNWTNPKPSLLEMRLSRRSRKK